MSDLVCGYAVATEDEQYDEVFYRLEDAQDARQRLNSAEDMGRWKVVPLYRSPTLNEMEFRSLRGMLAVIMYEPDRQAIESILARFR
jgi:hypothetical protein